MISRKLVPRLAALMLCAWSCSYPAELVAKAGGRPAPLIAPLSNAVPANPCELPATSSLFATSASAAASAIPATLDHLCPSFRVIDSTFEEIIIEPAKVVGAEYIISGSGQNASSRFGHAMMRISICHQEPCLEDQLEKISVGFAARTDSGYFSLRGGLNGRYLSSLSFTDDLVTQRKLLYEDLKDITYAPLILTPRQRRLLSYLLVERYWTHSGHYKFLSNNCASEILKVLKIVLADKAPILAKDEQYLTPKGLLKTLIKAGVVDSTQVKTVVSQKAALDGYVRSFHAMGLVPARSLDGYCDLSFSVRRKLIQSRSWDLQGRTRYQLLEKTCHRRLQAELGEAETKHIWKSKRQLTCDEPKERLQADLQSAYRALFSDQLRLRSDNVVPRNDEIVSEEDLKLRVRRLRRVHGRVHSCLSKIEDSSLMKLQRELKGTAENLKL